MSPMPSGESTEEDGPVPEFPRNSMWVKNYTDHPLIPLSKFIPLWMKAISLVRAAWKLSQGHPHVSLTQVNWRSETSSEKPLSPGKPMFHLQKKKKKSVSLTYYITLGRQLLSNWAQLAGLGVVINSSCSQLTLSSLPGRPPTTPFP